jgi:hypothetical protein
MKKNIVLAIILVLVTVGSLGAAYAAFSDKSKYLGTSFSVASADLKILNNVAEGTESWNLVDEKEGPVFTNIAQNWSQEYLIKIYNNATTDLTIGSTAYYETANDPGELRQIIFVEPFEWNDSNGNGYVDNGEKGISYGRKTIIKWKTEGFNLGQLGQGQVKGLILNFSTDAVADSKQGFTLLYDFEFSSVGI